MKKLTLIVHADVQQALADALRAVPAVTGFTFTTVEGHGPQEGRDAFLSARDRVVGYVPHVRVDILLEDRDVETVLEALQASNCGVAGRGVYWVSPVLQYGRL
jgi:nitrogen regulatory protein P-II 1